MARKGGSANASSSAIYLPRINRSLVERLESHLRSFNLTATEKTDEPKRALASHDFKPEAADHSTSLRSDQLENALLCVKNAARTMVHLLEQAGSVGERERLRTALESVEDRLSVFERDFDALSSELAEARRDAEEQRCRAQMAEDRLDNLMGAVTKMIAPLGHQESSHVNQILPAENAPLCGYGVRA